MDAITGGRSRSAKALFGVLKGVGWLVLLLVLLDVNIRRANALQGRDDNFKQGYVMSGFLLSLALAFALWFVVQHAIRKRRGYPPWIAVIAIGFSLLFAAADAVRDDDAQATAAAPADCKLGAQPYGAAPAGLRYVKATAAERARLPLGPEFRDADVSYALQGSERAAMLLAVPNPGEAYLQDAKAKARAHGATSRYDSAGGKRVVILDTPSTGTHAVFGVRGCVGVMVTGPQPRTVEMLARAALKG